MINLKLILWCCVLYIQFEQVFTATQSFFIDDIMVVEGSSCNSSEIKRLLIDRSVSKIYVYITHIFYADEDLALSGITELQIFANTWYCTHPVVFDLSGSDGKIQESSKVRGSPGNDGSNGKDGGNFFGLTKRTINGNYLRVISNGGSGGDGEDGSASDDVYVLLNAEDDTGDAAWFSGGDLRSYYRKYFYHRGYDAEISDIDDYTSFYAVFVHDKKATFNIRLHPRKCCGTTGLGGAGGLGGRRGSFNFKHLSMSYSSDKAASAPTFVGNKGSVGKLGKDGETCVSYALNVKIDVELKKVVFIFLPLHHSFSSKFTVLNHTASSKCSPEYVLSKMTVLESTVPIRVDLASSIIRYKIFLLKNMKSPSVKYMAQKMYKEIDENWEVNKEDSLRGLVLEACELENRHFELNKAINMTMIYERLLDRAERMAQTEQKRDEELALSCLRSNLEFKLNDLEREYNLIMKLEEYTETAVLIIDLRKRKLPIIPDINDVELRNSLNRLQFEINGRFILAEYQHVMEGFLLTYFPFAIEYLEEDDISVSPSDYNNLDEIFVAAIDKINAFNESIGQIKSNNAAMMMNLNYIDYSRPKNAFFVWKNSDISGEIRKLFEGEKITLLADVKQSERQFNAVKFNKVDLFFRSAQQNITDELNNVLKSSFEVHLNHNGRSSFRCNNNFYEITTPPVPIEFSFEKGKSEVPRSRLLTYDMLLENQPVLSPYASWEIQILPFEDDISELVAFARFPIDIELHGTGKYIEENVPICENEDLPKAYTQI